MPQISGTIVPSYLESGLVPGRWMPVMSFLTFRLLAILSHTIPCATVHELDLSSHQVRQTSTKTSTSCVESSQYSKASQPAATSQANYHLRSRTVSAILLTVDPMPMLSGSMKMPPVVGHSKGSRQS
jgi:hypothetical protein